MSSKKWYKKGSVFGTDPFGGSGLSDKTRVSPMGNAGGDNNFGLFESSDGNHHANDYFSESNEVFLTEKALEERKKENLKKKNKKKNKKKRYAQWGTNGPKIPVWGKSGDWVTKTYRDITSNDNWDKQSKQEISNIEIADILNSIVTIESSKGSKMETGSGFFIANNIVLTCAHVVVPEDGLQGSFISVSFGGKKNNAYVWSYDSNLDVAVVVIDNENFSGGSPLSLGNSDKVSVGENIIVVGSPLGFQNIVSKGIVSSEPIDYHEGDKDFNYIFISSNIFPGNSGGPIISGENNSVIGIAAAIITQEKQAQNGLSAIIPINFIKEFLLKNGIKFISDQ